VGATDIGQGSYTVLAQIAAEALGISYAKVIVFSSDTDVTPFDVGAYASSTTYISGGAVARAATDLRQQLADLLAGPWGCDSSEITFGGDLVRGPQGQVMTMQEVALHALYVAKVQPAATASHLSNESPPPFAAQFADVEVDVETGQVYVRRFVSAVDIGTVVHPRLAAGQVEGAVAQAVGYAICEEVLLDRRGRVLNPNFLDYKIPTALDLPEQQTIFVPTDEPSGPFGAKAAGEVPIDGPAPAIVNAICDAVGVRMYRIPATPERVWRALQQAGVA